MADTKLKLHFYKTDLEKILGKSITIKKWKNFCKDHKYFSLTDIDESLHDFFLNELKNQYLNVDDKILNKTKVVRHGWDRCNNCNTRVVINNWVSLIQARECNVCKNLFCSKCCDNYDKGSYYKRTGSYQCNKCYDMNKIDSEEHKENVKRNRLGKFVM